MLGQGQTHNKLHGGCVKHAEAASLDDTMIPIVSMIEYKCSRDVYLAWKSPWSRKWKSSSTKPEGSKSIKHVHKNRVPWDVRIPCCGSIIIPCRAIRTFRQSTMSDSQSLRRHHRCVKDRRSSNSRERAYESQFSTNV